MIICPRCRNDTLNVMDSLVCEQCDARFPETHGRPVLLHPDNAVFSLADYASLPDPKTNAVRPIGQRPWYLPTASVNLSRDRILAVLKARLSMIATPKILIVGGGQQRCHLDPLLSDNPEAQIVYTDIDINSDVDIFCDGHDLPFVDESFDAVITTAVLEHVLYPERVASEIQRVLKPHAFLYSELPFLQHVHEGAYDFTRYTMSGHTRLFNRINILEKGSVAGPATSLVWAIEGFFVAFARGENSARIAKLFGRVLFGWLKHLDRWLIKRPAAEDSASCTFVFGQRRDDPRPDVEIIAGYTGAQHTMHT